MTRASSACPNLKGQGAFPGAHRGEELWCRVVPDYDQDLCKEMLVEAKRPLQDGGSLDVHLNTIDGGLYHGHAWRSGPF